MEHVAEAHHPPHTGWPGPYGATLIHDASLGKQLPGLPDAAGDGRRPADRGARRDGDRASRSRTRRGCTWSPPRPSQPRQNCAASYTLGETGGPEGYRPTGWECEDSEGEEIPVADDQVTLAAGDSVTCTLTNKNHGTAPSPSPHPTDAYGYGHGDDGYGNNDQ
ncbi:hypothetical protein ABZ622_38990 [Streptomyces sp. NPDC007164]|uniref:prealbumin-like fold domain-containing protein n=1 Tax=Streptomyces sp. NPDC007164 TaxID=3156918 RepID=UPI0033EA2701